MKIKFDKIDLWWLLGMVGANLFFYGIDSVIPHYIVLNFVAGMTMIGVGKYRYIMEASKKWTH